MKYIVSLFVLLLICKEAVSEVAQTDTSKKFSNDRDALAYAYGLDRGLGLLRRYSYLKELGVELDIEHTKKGFLDAIASINDDKKSQTAHLTIEEVKSLIYAFDHEVAKIEQNLARIEASINIKKGKSFLNENSKKKNIIITDSGLQYRILKKGTGEKVKKEGRVVVHYKGRTIDGKEFDSTYNNDEKPRTLRVKNVIAGWQEALLKMRAGDEWELFVPPSLGYGSSRHGGIPADAVLIFNIKLIDVKN